LSRSRIADPVSLVVKKENIALRAGIEYIVAALQSLPAAPFRPQTEYHTHEGENMAQAKQGDTVRVHYTGKLEDGTVFDTSRERHPLQFTLGNGQVIAGFEQAVAGMKIGETKTTVIPVEQAYGPRRDDMVVTMSRENLPPNTALAVGQRIEITQADDQAFLATVTAVSEKNVTVDANHPLAGKALTFDLELVSIV